MTAIDASAYSAKTATAAATDTSKSAASKSKLAANFDTFLVMLTTQLKHQDPLSPMDSTQFTNQLVQFANVEQQINANSNLESLIKIQKVNQTSAAIGYLGQTVEIGGGGLALQDGKASFSYTLDEDAAAMAITIKDASGKAVRTIIGESGKGRHEMAWDGTDDNGNQLKNGVYSVEIVAMDAEQNQLPSATTTYGRVTDVSSDENGTLLSMSGVVTDLGMVLTIRDTASLAKTN